MTSRDRGRKLWQNRQFPSTHMSKLDVHWDSNSNNEKCIHSFEQYTNNPFEIIQLDLFHLKSHEWKNLEIFFRKIW